MASLCVWEKWLFVAPSVRDSSRSLGQTVPTRFGRWISPKKTKTCLAWLNRFWNAGTRHAPRNFQSTGTINERIVKNLLAGCARGWEKPGEGNDGLLERDEQEGSFNHSSNLDEEKWRNGWFVCYSCTDIFPRTLFLASLRDKCSVTQGGTKKRGY